MGGRGKSSKQLWGISDIVGGKGLKLLHPSMLRSREAPPLRISQGIRANPNLIVPVTVAAHYLKKNEIPMARVGLTNAPGLFGFATSEGATPNTPGTMHLSVSMLLKKHPIFTAGTMYHEGQHIRLGHHHPIAITGVESKQEFIRNENIVRRLTRNWINSRLPKANAIERSALKDLLKYEQPVFRFDQAWYKGKPKMGGRGRQRWSAGGGAGLLQRPGESAQLNLAGRVTRDPELSARLNHASFYLKQSEVPPNLKIDYTNDPDIYGERVKDTLFINRKAIRNGHPLFTAAIIYHEGQHFSLDPRMTRYGSSIRMENRVRTRTRKWARMKLRSGQAGRDEARTLQKIIAEQQPYVRKSGSEVGRQIEGQEMAKKPPKGYKEQYIPHWGQYHGGKHE